MFLAVDSDAGAMAFSRLRLFSNVWLSTRSLNPGTTLSSTTCSVDNSGTEYFIDDELIPELKDRTKDPAILDVPKTIATSYGRGTDDRRSLNVSRPT